MSAFGKAKNWARICGFFPGVMAVFLSGSFARGDNDHESDIDFFIIAQPGQIWTARFFVFFVLKIFQQLRHKNKSRKKICPNHFITCNSLVIKEQDNYSAKLFTSNIPLFDPYFLYPLFIHKNISWMRQYKCTIPSFPILQTYFIPKKSSIKIFAKILEKLLKKAQIFFITRNSDYNIKGAKIILEDNELRFHPYPKNKS